jgi:general secretion pathway protein K
MTIFDFRFWICDCGASRFAPISNLKSKIQNRKSGLSAEARRAKAGSALIVALWTLIILSLLIGSFAFDMQIEAGITSFYRKRLKTQYMARAGVEYAKLMLAKSFSAKKEAPDEGEDEDTYIKALNLQRGVAISGLTQELGDGRFTLDILPEQGRRNVNTLTDDDWKEILDQGNVPQEKWSYLIDCFRDYTDANDEHFGNGAESDDEFYMDRNYECKNAPLETVDELVLIKEFSPAIVFGGSSEEKGGDPYPGIAQWLTTWGDGKVNVNTATREVLLTIPGLGFAEDADQIIQGRAGKDGELGTKDDGWDSVDAVIAELGLSGADAQSVRDRITTDERQFVRVISKGEVEGVRSGIWAVFQADASGVIPLFWREEDMP